MNSMRPKIGLGISVYLQDFLDDRLAAAIPRTLRNLVSRKCSSIHLPEDDFLKTAALGDFRREQGMHLAVDCSSHELKRYRPNAALQKR